jgi:hypothetical protein
MEEVVAGANPDAKTRGNTLSVKMVTWKRPRTAGVTRTEEDEWWLWEQVLPGENVDEGEFELMEAGVDEIWVEEDDETMPMEDDEVAGAAPLDDEGAPPLDWPDLSLAAGAGTMAADLPRRPSGHSRRASIKLPGLTPATTPSAVLSLPVLPALERTVSRRVSLVSPSAGGVSVVAPLPVIAAPRTPADRSRSLVLPSASPLAVASTPANTPNASVGGTPRVRQFSIVQVPKQYGGGGPRGSLIRSTSESSSMCNSGRGRHHAAILPIAPEDAHAVVPLYSEQAAFGMLSLASLVSLLSPVAEARAIDEEEPFGGEAGYIDAASAAAESYTTVNVEEPRAGRTKGPTYGTFNSVNK